jgi:hypothetical protein
MDKELKNCIRERLAYNEDRLEISRIFKVSLEEIKSVDQPKPHRKNPYPTSDLDLQYFVLRKKVIEFNLRGVFSFGPDYSLQDIIDKFGPNPKCYISKEPIDLFNKSSYSLDHIKPKCDGGDNSLTNMEITKPIINYFKHSLSLDNFFYLCKEIVKVNNL